MFAYLTGHQVDPRLYTLGFADALYEGSALGSNWLLRGSLVVCLAAVLLIGPAWLVKSGPHALRTAAAWVRKVVGSVGARSVLSRHRREARCGAAERFGIPHARRADADVLGFVAALLFAGGFVLLTVMFYVFSAVDAERQGLDRATAEVRAIDACDGNKALGPDSAAKDVCNLTKLRALGRSRIQVARREKDGTERHESGFKIYCVNGVACAMRSGGVVTIIPFAEISRLDILPF